MSRSFPVAVLAAALLTSGALTALPAAAATGSVSLRSGTTPDTRPFPDNTFTVADSTQVTGRRVALPTAGCDAQGRSLCDDLALINQLDGFDIRPRVTLPFTAPVDLTTVTASTVHIDGPNGFSTGLVQLTQDAVSGTVAGFPSRYLAQDTTYTLVIANGIKATDGTLVGGLDRRVTFTTMTTTTPLAKIRGALDSGSAYTDAGIADTDRSVRFTEATGGGKSVFDVTTISALSHTDQVAADPSAQGAFSTAPILSSAKTYNYYGFGSVVTPQYVNSDAVIPNVPTTTTAKPLSNARVGVTMVSPAPSATCIQPVIFGHGYTNSNFDLFNAADTLGSSNLAVFSLDIIGHGFGPQSTWSVTTSSGTTSGLAYGRGRDFDGDGRISSSEGSTPSPKIVRAADGSISVQPSPYTAAALRDSLVQSAIDEMALVRALEKGVDVNGDGTVDTCTAAQSKVAYYGMSWGGMYGALLLASDPHLEFGALAVPGSTVSEIARLGGFRGLLSLNLQFQQPGLLNGGPGLNGFTESIPLRRDPKLAGVVQGAVQLQEQLARLAWVGRTGSPDAYAQGLRPVPGEKNVIVQVAYGDGTLPNPTSNDLLRAGDLYAKSWIYRNDRTANAPNNPHGYMTRIDLPAHFEAQEQIRRFIASKGTDERDPDATGDKWESGNTDFYKVQLDCLHFPDPQTGQPQTRTSPATECTDRSAEVTPEPAQPKTRYVALATPTRVVDTRSGLGTTKGAKTGRFTVELGKVISDAAANSAVLNVTVLGATKGGYVTVFPEGMATPATSNVNVAAAVPGVRENVQANEVVTRLSQHRRVDVNVATTAQVLVDVVGYFTPTATPGAGRVTTVQPRRLLDTRTTAQERRTGEVVVDVSGTAATATAVILNVTVTSPDHRGHVVAYPTGTPVPSTSNVNFETGQTQANEVMVRVGAGGKVSLGIAEGVSTALVVDLVGQVVPTDDASGRDYTTLPKPRRLIDTRSGVGLPTGKKKGPSTFTLPADLPAGIVGVLLNVTATDATAPGFVTVYPGGLTRPATSNVNFVTSTAQANEVLTGVSSDRRVVFDVGGTLNPSTQLVVDMVGYLTAQ